ncbi:hypothetical protein BU15DRAFT_64987 [Melanogaster broomeanus]|nr:hypothetical protein BU15DRAFT_64987 [Melanogaster broomeanus]
MAGTEITTPFNSFDHVTGSPESFQLEGQLKLKDVFSLVNDLSYPTEGRSGAFYITVHNDELPRTTPPCCIDSLWVYAEQQMSHLTVAIVSHPKGETPVLTKLLASRSGMLNTVLDNVFNALKKDHRQLIWTTSIAPPTGPSPSSAHHAASEEMIDRSWHFERAEGSFTRSGRSLFWYGISDVSEVEKRVLRRVAEWRGRICLWDQRKRNWVVPDPQQDLIGARGYTSQALTSLLNTHPYLSLTHVSSRFLESYPLEGYTKSPIVHTNISVEDVERMEKEGEVDAWVIALPNWNSTAVPTSKLPNGSPTQAVMLSLLNSSSFLCSPTSLPLPGPSYSVSPGAVVQYIKSMGAPYQNEFREPGITLPICLPVSTVETVPVPTSPPSPRHRHSPCPRIATADNAKSKREFKKLSKNMGDKLDKEKGRRNASTDLIRQRAAEKERNHEASQNAQPGTIKRMQFRHFTTMHNGQSFKKVESTTSDYKFIIDPQTVKDAHSQSIALSKVVPSTGTRSNTLNDHANLTVKSHNAPTTRSSGPGATTTSVNPAILRGTGNNSAPGRVEAECSNSGAIHTPLWRHGLNDELSCNAHGLYCKLVDMLICPYHATHLDKSGQHKVTTATPQRLHCGLGGKTTRVKPSVTHAVHSKFPNFFGRCSLTHVLSINPLALIPSAAVSAVNIFDPFPFLSRETRNEKQVTDSASMLKPLTIHGYGEGTNVICNMNIGQTLRGPIPIKLDVWAHARDTMTFYSPNPIHPTYEITSMSGVFLWVRLVTRKLQPVTRRRRRDTRALPIDTHQRGPFPSSQTDTQMLSEPS